MSGLEQLVGAKLLDARYDGTSIFLNTTTGSIALTPEGDCCARCYVQHVSFAFALVDAVVAKVEQIESEPTEVELAEPHDVLVGWGSPDHDEPWRVLD